MTRMHVIAVSAIAGTTASVSAQVTLLDEDFDSIQLREPIDEPVPADPPTDVWTDRLPDMWYRDRCLTPMGGVTEWRGWNIADGLWWAALVGGQERETFTFPLNGAGLSEFNLMVADGDEWDDADHPDGDMDTTLYSPELAVAGLTDVTVEFDSSFRPYDAQAGTVSVSFDGGAPTQLLLLDTSTVPGGSSSLDRANEHITLPVAVPNGAQKMVVEWAYVGGNDWWWAIDNVHVTGNTTPSNAPNSASMGDCPPEPPACSNPADFDGNDLINTNDFFAFLAAYQQGCP